MLLQTLYLCTYNTTKKDMDYDVRESSKTMEVLHELEILDLHIDQEHRAIMERCQFESRS